MDTRLDLLQTDSRFLVDAELPESTFCQPQRSSDAPRPVDLDSRLSDALANPVDYPPIPESIFEGDQVAIAFQSNLAEPEAVTRALLRALSNQLKNQDFVLVTSEQTASRLKSFAEINGKLIVHYPSDQNGLSMMGINELSEPVYINRHLFDADVVIPVCSAGFDSNESSDCIYPYFSGLDDRERFETRASGTRAGQVRLANNQLGTFWSIYVVFGPGNQVYDVIVGEQSKAKQLAKEKMDLVWRVNVETESDFVIGTIESHPVEQTWDDFCTALIAADQVSHPGAPIVICCDLSNSPKRKIRSALTQQFGAEKSSGLNAVQKSVAEIVRDHTVFVSSQLSQTATEELGLGHIASATELQRLIKPAQNGILLRDAHRCRIHKPS